MPDNTTQTTQNDRDPHRTEHREPEVNPAVPQQQFEAGDAPQSRLYWQVPGTSQPDKPAQKREQFQEWTKERERDDFGFSW